MLYPLPLLTFTSLLSLTSLSRPLADCTTHGYAYSLPSSPSLCHPFIYYTFSFLLPIRSLFQPLIYYTIHGHALPPRLLFSTPSLLLTQNSFPCLCYSILCMVCYTLPYPLLSILLTLTSSHLVAIFH
uniref:Secreted peptide n=1 Tax=Rhipicephalus pulchellus TaxID=72859 RepID=L7LVK9_RHIPC